jgi:iron complex outermembrane receptor protein
MADLQLPGSMSEAQYNEYLKTGRQTATQDVWKTMGRSSNILFANMRYEQELGPVTLKPRVYGTWWQHYHPVTGFINVSDGNYVFGTDLEAHWKHDLFGLPSKLVGGVTLRQDMTRGSKKYTYKDLLTQTTSTWKGSTTTILETLSDDTGDLAAVEDTTNTVYGVFAEDSIKLTEALTLDLGMRFDRSHFDISSFEYIGFDYANNAYTSGGGATSVNTSYDLFSPKAALSYAVTPNWTVYGTVARAGQVPSTSELSSNPELEAGISTLYEVGVKARLQGFRLDAALYYNPVENEIVSQKINGETVYNNAGKTDKKGFEIAASYEVMAGLTLGGGYSFSAYKFDQYSEISYASGKAVNVDRSGNTLPFIPEHQYSLFADYKHPSGFKARVQTETWGEYYMDYANTEKYPGYAFVTKAMVGYDFGPHSVMLTANNLFDQRYAVEVTKDTAGSKDYYAAEGRLVMLTYRLKM